MGQPGQGPRPTVDQAERVEDIEGLRRDPLALADDQVTATHRDRGQAVAAEQLLDPPLAQKRIAAQIAAALQAADHETAAQLAALLGLILELQTGRLQQRSIGQGSGQPLAQHAVLGAPHVVLPGGQGDRIEAPQPEPLGAGEVERVNPGQVAAALLPHLLQRALQLVLQLAGQPLIDHLHGGAGHHLAAALLESGTVHHGGVTGSPHRERSRQAWPQTGLHQPGPAGQQSHQQAGQHHGGHAGGAPADDRLARAFQPQQAPPHRPQSPHRVRHRLGRCARHGAKR